MTDDQTTTTDEGTTTETTSTEQTVSATETKGFQWDGPIDPDRAARYVENLKQDSKAAKDALATANAKLAEYEQAKMTEQEKLTQRAEEAEKRLVEVQRSLMVNEAARKYGLPDDFSQFLSGSTPEEIEEKAKVLAERVQPTKQAPPTKPQVKPVPGSGANVDSQTQLTLEDLANMKPEEVMKAKSEGRLENILSGQ